MPVNIQISEGQIDSLIKLVLVEERKKQILLEDTVWERTPPGKSKDPIGYWKILFDQLKKGGIGVKWEVTNDPVKSTFMYWGMWVIWKDINKGVVWQDPKTKKTYKFKWDGGKYAGQSAENIKLIYGTTKFNLLDYSKSSSETIISNLNKISGRDSVWIDLGQKLNSYKPKTATYFEGKDTHVVVYPGNKPEDKKQLEFKKDGTIWFTDKPGSVKNNGAKWDKKSIKDGKLAGGWLTNNQNKKVSLGDALSEPQFNFGILDDKVTGKYFNSTLEVWLQSTGEHNRWYNSIKTKCNLPSIPLHLQGMSSNSTKVRNMYFCMLKNNPPSKFISHIIRDSVGYITDDEEFAEAAFMAIKNLAQYEQVKYYLGEDPYTYVSKAIEVNQKFYEIPIHKSYERIIQSTISKKDESLGCKNVILKTTKPAGPNHNENFKDLINLMGQGYFKNENQNTIPSDFGWSKNNNIYPKPILYTIKEIESCKNTIEKQKKLYPTVKTSPKQYNKDSESTVVRNIVQPKEIRYAPKEFSDNQNNLLEMKTFNFELSQQSRLIPKYCKRQWSKTYNYYDEDKIKNPNYINPVTGKHDVAKTKTYSIPYSKLCEDFGGLWVFNGSTSSPECFCRDYSHPYLNLDMEIKPFRQGGYVIKANDEKLNFKEDNKKSINWSNDDSKLAAAKVIGFIGAVFAPTLLGQLIAAGINLGIAKAYYDRGDYRNAAIEAFFAVLGPLNKIPAVAKFWKTEMLIPMKRGLIDSGILTKKAADWWVKLLGLETILSKSIGKELEKRLGKEAFNTYAWRTAFNAIKEIEKKIAEKMGLTKKGITKIAADL